MGGFWSFYTTNIYSKVHGSGPVGQNGISDYLFRFQFNLAFNYIDIIKNRPDFIYEIYCILFRANNIALVWISAYIGRDEVMKIVNQRQKQL